MSWFVRPSALPPLAMPLGSALHDEPTEMRVAELVDEQLQSISGFLCIIEYNGELRLITGRRYDLIGSNAYVGAICQTAHGYRQFHCDRIRAVFDAHTGEELGDGTFFEQFRVDQQRERAPTWGLTPGRKYLLVSGLNVLAFMARCDGRWHPLETEPIERFICSLWLRKGWEGEPPLGEIIEHAKRLAPDGEVFFNSLKPFTTNNSSMSLLRRSVAELIEADGIVCNEEFHWSLELEDTIEQASAEATEEFISSLQLHGVLD